MTKDKVLAVARQYLYAALTAVATAFAAGYTSPKELGSAALVAVLGPILAAIDPKHTEYGVGSPKG
jgi:hypothetical protein